MIFVLFQITYNILNNLVLLSPHLKIKKNIKNKKLTEEEIE